MWVATNPYIVVSAAFGTATVLLQGNSDTYAIQFAGQLGGVPSDATVDAAAPLSIGGDKSASTTYPTSVNNVIYGFKVKITGDSGVSYHSCTIFYVSNVGVGSSGTPYRSLQTLYVWDAFAWRTCFTAVDITNAYGTYVGTPFFWYLDWYTNITVPAGYILSVKEVISGVEAGPYNIAGSSSSTIMVVADSAQTYHVQLRDPNNIPVGTIHTVTPV